MANPNIKPEPRVVPPYNQPESAKSFNFGDPDAVQRLTVSDGLEMLVRLLPLIQSFLSHPKVQAAVAEVHQERMGQAAPGSQGPTGDTPSQPTPAVSVRPGEQAIAEPKRK
jgi:hypothetical protein